MATDPVVVKLETDNQLLAALGRVASAIATNTLAMVAASARIEKAIENLKPSGDDQGAAMREARAMVDDLKRDLLSSNPGEGTKVNVSS